MPANPTVPWRDGVLTAHGPVTYCVTNTDRCAERRPSAGYDVRLESGPAAGVVGCARLLGETAGADLLAFDAGGTTSKVAIVSRSTQPGCDVDYLFAQVGVGQKSVDTRPNCGNMLSGVAPFAIEQGLVAAQDGETRVRVYNVNTRSRIDVTVLTPGGRVVYAGETAIDGVAGSAAPIRLNFLDAWGAVTGSLFPTGQRIDRMPIASAA